MMLIFSSRQRLHLLLKLSGVGDFLINLYSICGVRPLSLKLQNHLNRAVRFLSKGLGKEYDGRTSISNFQLRFQYKPSLPYYFPWG